MTIPAILTYVQAYAEQFDEEGCAIIRLTFGENNFEVVLFRMHKNYNMEIYRIRKAFCNKK